MRKAILPLLFAGTLLLASCARPMPLQSTGQFGQLRAPGMPMAQLQRRSTVPLVSVEGLATGDNLRVKGPFFTSGKGKVHNLTPDAFKIEFQIAGHHLIVDATRIDAEKVRFITIDLKAGRTVEGIGNYRRSGTVTVFEMGPGQEVEKLTVRPIKPGNFETDVVQPGFMFPSDRGSNTLKFFKE